MKGNTEQAFRFLQALYGGQREGFAFLTGQALGWRSEAFNLGDPRAIEAMATRAVELGDVRASVAVYQSAHSRRAGNYLSARAAMLDCDGQTLLRFASRPASIEVASGGETNGSKHLHALWLLAEPVSAGELSDLQRGLRDTLGGDPSWNASATALVRIPGTEHRKGGRLRKVEAARATERKYQPSELRHCFRSKRTIPSRQGGTERTAAPADRDAAVQAVEAQRLSDAGEGSRELAGYRLACDLRRLGLSEADATGVAERWHRRVSESIEKDHPYELPDLLGSIGRVFGGRSRTQDMEAVDRWELEALADRRLSPSAKAIVSVLAERMRATGSTTVTASVRSLAVAARVEPKTVGRAMRGSKRYLGLHGRWLRKARKGEEGAQRWAIRRPKGKEQQTLSSSPLQLSLHALLPANCGHFVSPSHDAFSVGAIGPAPRLTLGVLSALTEPVSVAQIAGSPFLPRDRRSIRRHLERLARFNLARQLPDGRWRADVAELPAKLDAAAEATGKAGRGERLARRFHRERLEDRERRQAYGERCAADRDRSRADLHRRTRFGCTQRKEPPMRSKPRPPKPRRTKRPRPLSVGKRPPSLDAANPFIDSEGRRKLRERFAI